jgi:hypothetical protein
VYHIELRQFPHNLCRFNLSERELRAITEAWMQEPWVELGERKWSPHQARLTVLEGPQIPLEQLSMGRGWGTAQRQSENVTEQVLAAAKKIARARSEGSSEPSPPDAALVADSLGLELMALLADGPEPLSRAWRLAAARFPDRSPGESLALAEQAVGSLLHTRLIVLQRQAPHGPDDHGDPTSDGEAVGEDEVGSILRASASWSDQDGSAGILMSRA